MSLVNILKRSDTIRDLYGSTLIIKSWWKYLFNPPYRHAIAQLPGNDKDTRFEDYFTKVEIARRGKIQTEGINLISKQKSDRDGKAWLEFLIAQGLTPQHKVLDYGCGSLRLGKTLIEYLEPGNYVGVDISDTFYSQGLENYVPKTTQQDKQPRFYVIDSPEYKKAMQDLKFDFVYSQWVAMHVPAHNLEHYFDNIFNQMHQHSRFYFDFCNSIVTMKKNALTWGYSTKMIRGLIARKGFSSERLLGNTYKVKRQREDLTA